MDSRFPASGRRSWCRHTVQHNIPRSRRIYGKPSFANENSTVWERSQSKNDSEEDYQEVVLDPDGNPAYYWMGVVTLAIVYNYLVVILRLAFKEFHQNFLYQIIFLVLDILCDLVYTCDIPVQLRTAYLEDGILVVNKDFWMVSLAIVSLKYKKFFTQVINPTKLSSNYQHKQEFIKDMASLFPFGMISSLLLSEDFGPIARLPRLLKYHTMARFFEITDSRTSNPNLVRAVKLSLHLWVIIHWSGCFYYMISKYEGLGVNDWVYTNNSDSQTLLRKYIVCTYWSLMTLTTIGEQPSPTSELEYVFTGFTFLLGMFVFAAVVGNVGDIISNMNASRQNFQSRMDQIKFFMRHRQVPEFLQNRVKKWAYYSWARTQAIDESSLLQILPERLRTEIAIYIHLETLKKVKIFKQCDEGLLQELVLKLKPQIYSPEDYICRAGEIGREMYIINHGIVEILVSNSLTGEKTVVATLTAGNHFGEISLLKVDDGQNRRTADVCSLGYSELLCLSRKDLMVALVEYPNAKRILEAQARERMQQTKEMSKCTTFDSATCSTD